MLLDELNAVVVQALFTTTYKQELHIPAVGYLALSVNTIAPLILRLVLQSLANKQRFSKQHWEGVALTPKYTGTQYSYRTPALNAKYHSHLLILWRSFSFACN